jgi:hypothetical protein
VTAGNPPGTSAPPPSPPAPGPGDPACAHELREGGVCTRCGHCEHDVVLNGACYYCGTTELDPIAMSPKKPPAVIPAQRLVRKK